MRSWDNELRCKREVPMSNVEDVDLIDIVKSFATSFWLQEEEED